MTRLPPKPDHVPTSTVGRLGRLARSLLRSWRLSRGRDGELDPETLASVVADLGRLKGVAMKAGQVMSYVDVALPEQMRRALAALQTQSQAMPFESVRGVLREDLGARAADLLAEMSPEPVAAASIGQVHRTRLPSGVPVAVKVRYPNVEAAIAADFRAAKLGSGLASLFYPGADAAAFVREARDGFLAECDYAREAACQSRFRAIHEGDPTISIPAVHGAYTTTRVLVTTWVDGQMLEPWLATRPSQEQRDRVGRALFEFYVGTLFRCGVYNCDPHPGNQLYLPDGRVAILDHGATRIFEPGFVARLARLTRAAQSDEPAELESALVALGFMRPGDRDAFAAARMLVRAFYGPMLLDERTTSDPARAIQLDELARRKRELMRLRLPGELLFLFRIRFGLMSLLSRLGARENWRRLEREIVDRPTTMRPQARSSAP